MIKKGSKPFPGCKALEDFALGAGGWSGRATYKGALVHMKIPDDHKCPIGAAATGPGARARIAEFEAFVAAWERRIAALKRCSVRDYLIPTAEFVLFDPSPRVRQAALISPFVEGLEKTIDLAGHLGDLEKRQFAATAILQLRALHADAGLVHSDGKPPNIQVYRGAGTVQARFLDFDASWFIGEVPPPEAYVGDPYYFAPEVVAYFCGGAPGRIGPKVDVFSLGVMLAELFADERMPGLDRATAIKYPADAMAAGSLDVHAWLTGRGVDEETAGMLARMLHPDPDQRLSSAEADDAMASRHRVGGSVGVTAAPAVSTVTPAFVGMKGVGTVPTSAAAFAPMKGVGPSASSAPVPAFVSMKGDESTTAPAFTPMKGGGSATATPAGMVFAPMKGGSEKGAKGASTFRGMRPSKG
jgi:hypothetical protein